MNPNQAPQQGPPSGVTPTNPTLQPPVNPQADIFDPSQVAATNGSGSAVSMGNPLEQPSASAGATPDKNNQQNINGVSAKQVAAKNPNSSQNSLLLTEVRDGIAVMNDGSMRAMVACRSINFDLMSSRERESVEFSYQNFLNSLYFPIQILIRSQRVDIAPYLEQLSKMRRDQDNMLLGVLMDDYIGFIADISEQTNIMDKSFFIIIPYYPAGDLTSAVNTSKNLLANLFTPQKQSVVHIEETAYQKAKDEMQNRVLTVTNGLAQIGIQAARLNTTQISEMFYSFYNPDTALREPLINFDPTPAVVIRKGKGEAPQPHLERGAA